MDVVGILVRGIGQQEIGGDPEDTRRFQENIEEVSNAFSGDLDPKDLAVHARAALTALEEHNRRIARRQNLQSAELQNMVKMLTSTVGTILETGNANAHRLGNIEKQVAMLSAMDDIRLLKTKLSECLIDIRTEVERQRKETSETIEELNKSLDQARSNNASASSDSATDAVTGLPERAQAEAEFAHATRNGTQVFAAVLVLDRLQVVNVRFGREVGDQVLVAFASMIKKLLHPTDTLFRWSGPTLVALLPRTTSLERVRSEIAHIAETKLEHIIETAERSILLPFSARWVVLPMVATPRALYQQIDTFSSPNAAK